MTKFARRSLYLAAATLGTVLLTAAPSAGQAVQSQAHTQAVPSQAVGLQAVPSQAVQAVPSQASVVGAVVTDGLLSMF